MENDPGNHGIAVLVVDDEPIIRMDVSSLIEEAGFTFYEAANADEAIGLLGAHDEVSLVFTDINMPGSMDGLELAHYVRQRWPCVKIIVMSGHVKVRRQDLPTDATFIRKPYDPKEIAHQLQDLAASR